MLCNVTCSANRCDNQGSPFIETHNKLYVSTGASSVLIDSNKNDSTTHYRLTSESQNRTTVSNCSSPVSVEADDSTPGITAVESQTDVMAKPALINRGDSALQTQA